MSLIVGLKKLDIYQKFSRKNKYVCVLMTDVHGIIKRLNMYSGNVIVIPYWNSPTIFRVA
jgi:hypothetical protein